MKDCSSSLIRFHLPFASYGTNLDTCCVGCSHAMFLSIETLGEDGVGRSFKGFVLSVNKVEFVNLFPVSPIQHLPFKV